MKTKTKQVQTVNRETAINENEIKREIVLFYKGKLNENQEST